MMTAVLPPPTAEATASMKVGQAIAGSYRRAHLSSREACSSCSLAASRCRDSSRRWRSTIRVRSGCSEVGASSRRASYSAAIAAALAARRRSPAARCVSSTTFALATSRDGMPPMYASWGSLCSRWLTYGRIVPISSAGRRGMYVMEHRESWLADVMIELADSLDVRESAYLSILTRRLSELVSPAEIGLLVTTDTGSLTTAAASSARMRDLVSVESRLKEGPCTTSHGTGQQLRLQTLDAVDARWPRFGPAAREAGFASVSAYPLRRR